MSLHQNVESKEWVLLHIHKHFIYRHGALYTATGTRVTLLACQWVALRHSRRKANLNTHAQDHAMSAFTPFEMAPTHVHFLHRAPSVHSLAKEVTGLAGRPRGGGRSWWERSRRTMDD